MSATELVEDEEEEVYYVDNDDDSDEYEYIDSDNNDNEDDNSSNNHSNNNANKKEESPTTGTNSRLQSKRKAADALLLNHSSQNSGCFTSSSATTIRGFKHWENCPRCNQENHTPVADCNQASAWIKRTIDESSGISTLPTQWILPAISKRISDVATRLNASEEEAALLLREHRWNVETFERNYWNVDVLAAPPGAQNNTIINVEAPQHRLRQINQNHNDFLRSTIAESSAQAGQQPPHPPPPPPPLAQPQQGREAAGTERNRECGICMEQVDNTISLDCGHPFCVDCWGQYLAVSFEGNFGGGHQALQTKCPIPACTELATEQLIRRVAPNLVPRFQEHLLDAFVEANRQVMRWCPGADCQRVAVKPRDGLFVGCNNTMFCGEDGCNNRYCFECGLEPHDGRCTIPDIALRNPQAGGANNNNNGKDKADKLIQRCPQCKTPIQKNGGCNHMTCKCGCHFCWLCGGDITNRPHEHFCGRLPNQQLRARNNNNNNNRNNNNYHINNQRAGGAAVPVVAFAAVAAELANERAPIAPVNLDFVRDALLESRNDNDNNNHNEDIDNFIRKYREMERFAHYYNRFAAHNQGQQFAEGQCGCVRGRADNFYKLSGIKSATDTDFFFAANERLVACRRMLKYSYCYVYRMTSGTAIQVDADNGDGTNDGDFDVVSPRIALFQNYQEQLERYTEQLSELSERALTHQDREKVVDLIEIVGRSMKAVHDFELEESSFAN